MVEQKQEGDTSEHERSEEELEAHEVHKRDPRKRKLKKQFVPPGWPIPTQRQKQLSRLTELNEIIRQ